MKVWILEDNAATSEIIKTKVRECLGNVEVEVLETIEAAHQALEKISDADLLFVDSQVPAKADSQETFNVGEQFVAKVRVRGCVCRVLWHSISPMSSPSDLGIERIRPKDIRPNLFASDRSSEQLIRKQEWQRYGQVFLSTLKAQDEALSEFVPLSILCQGYLIIVGAAGLFPDEIVDQLKGTKAGQAWLHKAKAHLDQVLNTGDWFASGRESISAAINSSGSSEEVYWRNIDDTEFDSEAIRRLYENVSEPSTRITGEEFHQLVADAHQSLQCLFERRYL